MQGIIDGNMSLAGVQNRFGRDCKFWDDGFGPLWVYESADWDFGIIRAQTWEEAYSCVEDEILPRAQDEDVEADFPGWREWPNGEAPDPHTQACFDEAYGWSGNNGLYAKPLNGERLERLTPARVRQLGLRLRWRR